MVGPRQAAPKQILFPNNEKTKSSEQILRYAYLVLEPTLSQRRAASNSRTGELEGSVIANGGVNDLLWNAVLMGSVAGTVCSPTEN